VGSHVQIEFGVGRPGDYKGKEVSAEKARRILGWVPEIEFEEGMRRTVEWYRETYAAELGLVQEALRR
jgi:UDP-glucose 4-epimerase